MENYESVDLVPIKLATIQFLSQKQLFGAAANLRLQCLSCIGDKAGVELTTYILGMEDERIIVDKQWPRDWWQAIRERWFPKWYLARYPVAYDKVEIDVPRYKAVCPHLIINDSKPCMDFLHRSK